MDLSGTGRIASRKPTARSLRATHYGARFIGQASETQEPSIIN